MTQANITTTICVRGYTATVRPPVSVTEPIKRERLAAYGLATDSASLTSEELDHLVALEIGGAPRSLQNLWPEPWDGSEGAHAKDTVENAAHAAVCNGSMPLTEAQDGMATDWRTLGHTLGVKGF